MDIPYPEKFSFDTQKWPAWKLRFQRFRMASDLRSKDEERQVSMLLYCMGEKSEDVFASFKLTADDAKKYDVVLNKFDAHFVVKRNVIFERAQFNNRRQEQGESMEAFITALHKLAETCEFGALREELIRDRIVVGIQDSKLSEKLQLDKDLTLDKAVTLVRQAEQVRQQQGLLRSTSATTSATSEVNAVKANKSQDRNRQQKLRKQNQGQPCKWCGRTPRHEREQCPARNATCRNCNKPGHFEKVCRSEKAAIRAVDATIDTLFVDTLKNNLSSSDTWQAELKVNDKLVKFRLDTGADATVLPLDTFNQLLSAPLSPPDKVLCGPNRAKLDVVGYFTAVLEWRGKQTTQTVYVLRDVHQPLLGQSAIEALGLIKRLCAVTDNTDPKQQYSDLFTGLGCMEGEYTIRLKPDAQPFAVFTPRRVPVNLLPQLKNELDKLESLGVIKRVDEPTPWVAPIVVIPKKTSGIRLCVDLTQLNNAVLREQYTLPAIDQMLARIAGAKVFSKLDCNSGFYQIPLSNESMLLTTFTTPYGRWCYTRLPFGISSASEVYQRKMNDILRDLDGVQCLIDDVLVYGKDKTEHDARLHSVLDRFRRANVTLNDKCEFGVTQIKFAGHVISSDGISVDPNKLTAIINMTPPTDATGMRCFMGMVNQLAKFSSNIAELSAPLRDLLRKDREWVWDAAQQTAFDDVKQAIASAPVLALYDPSRPTLISADSSSYGLGAVLKQQQHDSTWRPVVFASRALNDVERRYAQVEKECLALTWACERFSDYVIGTRFILQTDHKPLTSLLSPLRALDDVPPRIQRMRIRLMRFDFSVEYLPGSQLFPADTLSRFPLRTQPELIDSSDIVERYVSVIIASLPLTDVMIDKVRVATATDYALQRVIEMCNNGTWPDDVSRLAFNVQPYWHSRDFLTVQEGLLLHNARIVIPDALRQTTLEALHSSGHLGIEKCRTKARLSIWWPKMSTEIESFVASCQVCLHYAKDRAEPLVSTQLPDLPWQKVGTDLFELNNKHYIVVVDYYSRYIELAELRNETADDVIRALKAIFARHGIPMLVFSDNGPCYGSATFNSFARTYGFEHRTSSPRYAQSNGASERAVQTAKSLLKKADDIYLALLSYRTTPLVNGFSPAQLLMGRQLRSTVPTTTASLQPQTPDTSKLQEIDRDIKARQATSYNASHRARDGKRWQVNDRVWVPDLQSEAIVIGVLPYRAYQLRTAANNIIRRNGRSLRHPLPAKSVTTSTEALPSASLPSATTNARCRVRDIATPPQQPRAVPPPPNHQRHMGLPTTRSGRTIRPPTRLNT